MTRRSAGTRPQLFRLAVVVLALAASAPTAAKASSFTLPTSSGGPGGDRFVQLPPPGAEIAALRVRSGALIDAVEIVYRSGAGLVATPRHGGTGGNPSELELGPGEHIVEISGRSGQYVDSLRVRTSRGRTRQWGGPGGERAYRYTAPAGARISGLWGRAGSLVDAIAPVVESSGNPVTIPAPGSSSPSSSGLGGFSTAHLQGGVRGKADSVTPSGFPHPPGAGGDEAERWVRQQAASLEPILRTLASSDADFQQYRQRERDACQGNAFYQLPYRQQAIAYALGIRR